MCDGNCECKIKVTENGPYIVLGSIPMSDQTIIDDEHGNSIGWEEGISYPEDETYALCRCGKSSNKPYCDGTHESFDFDGLETAGTKDYIDCADKIEGESLVLLDNQNLCAVGRFCDVHGNAWVNAKKSDNSECRKIAIEQACNCPSGRLVAWDKETGETIEPEFEPSIGLIEDPCENVSGPIWARGGIPFESADGDKYEIRNRVTLCRCGQSKNKPFCDGSHISSGFRSDR